MTNFVIYDRATVFFGGDSATFPSDLVLVNWQSWEGDDGKPYSPWQVSLFSAQSMENFTSIFTAKFELDHVFWPLAVIFVVQKSENHRYLLLHIIPWSNVWRISTIKFLESTLKILCQFISWSIMHFQWVSTQWKISKTIRNLINQMLHSCGQRFSRCSACFKFSKK